MGTYVGCISCMSHEVFHGAHVANLEDRGQSKSIKKTPQTSKMKRMKPK